MRILPKMVLSLRPRRHLACVKIGREALTKEVPHLNPRPTFEREQYLMDGGHFRGTNTERPLPVRRRCQKSSFRLSRTNIKFIQKVFSAMGHRLDRAMLK